MPNSAPEVFQGYFRKRRHFISKKLKFWTFGDCMSNNNFWKAFWRKISVFSVYENFQVFFRKKKHLFFSKNAKYWTSSKHMTNSKVGDVFEKNLSKLGVFESFETFFFKWSIYFFFQKRPNSESFENSWAVNFFGTYYRWN